MHLKLFIFLFRAADVVYGSSQVRGWSCSCPPTPEPQHHQKWAVSATYTTACSKVRWHRNFGSHMTGLVPIQNETRERLLSLSLSLCYEGTKPDNSQKKNSLTRAWPYLHLDIEFTVPTLWENKFLFFKLSVDPVTQSKLTKILLK